MIVRASPIGDMVINTVSSLADTLFSSREVTDIAVVIITPHQGHIIRNLQAGVINIKYFFIRYKNLRNLSHIFIHIFLYQATLISEYTVQHSFLLFYRLGTLHLAIMYATHTKRIEYFLICHFFHPVFPEFIDSSTVIYIVIRSIPSSSPLSGSTASHRFTMGSPHKDPVLLCHFPIAFSQEKGERTFVHGRPVGVSS